MITKNEKVNTMILCSFFIAFLATVSSLDLRAEDTTAQQALPVLTQQPLNQAVTQPQPAQSSTPVQPAPVQEQPQQPSIPPVFNNIIVPPLPSLPPATPEAQSAPQPQPPQQPTAPAQEVPAAPISTQQTPAQQPEQKPAEQPQQSPSPKDQKNVALNQAEEEKNIYLNFENTELFSFIDYIAEIKKLNLIPDKTLEGSKISLSIREPLSVEGAWNIFLTVLEMAGFSIIQTGPVHKIIPKDKKLQQPLPAYINVPYTELPDSDLTVRYVMILSNIQVDAVKPLLESMLSTPNSLLDQKEMNAFIITDKAYNIKSAAKLLTELDQMGLPETVTVLRLKRANAVDVKTLFDALIKKPDTNPIARILGKATEGSTEFFSASTRIIPEERTNSLILMGTTESVQKIIDFVTENIDTDLKESESPLHIYELQYVDATQIATILKEVTTTQLESSTGQAAAKYGSIRGGVKYFRDMKFEVDKDGNRLIVSCIDKQDWKLLKKTLDDLDKPQPQVGIEALVVSINSDDLKNLGGAIRSKKHGQLGINVDGQSASISTSGPVTAGGTPPTSILGNMLSQLTASFGQSVLTFGKLPGTGDPATPGNIWGVFQMIQTKTNASILSQPFVTVANQMTATVDIGETKRVVDSEANSGQKGYIDASASTHLEIKPQINLDGLLNLSIKIVLSEFTNDAGTATTTKTVDTNVSVADGQVLILGGFIKTKATESKNKTPILGDIPLLGWLFKQQQKTVRKEYVFIFLSPTIIKPRQLPGMQLYTKMKLHQATEDIEEAIETKRTMDPIHNWFFNAEKENYSHKVVDFANARYQPTTVDIRHDHYYRSEVEQEKPLAFKDSPVEQKEPEIAKKASDVTSSIADNTSPRATHASLQMLPPTTDTNDNNNEIDIDAEIERELERDNEEVEDPDIEEKRRHFKELLESDDMFTDNTPQETEQQTLPTDAQRESFKNLLSPDDSSTPQQTTANPMTARLSSRNNIKQFLTSRQTLAHNNSRNHLRTRRMSV